MRRFSSTVRIPTLMSFVTAYGRAQNWIFKRLWPRLPLLLILLMGDSLAAFQSVPNLAGTWTVTQTLTLTLTAAGESETITQTDTGVITLTQTGNTVTYYLDVRDPFTGQTSRLQRVGTIVGNTVTFTGTAIVPVEGFTFSKNSSVVVGTIQGDRIDAIATIDVAFSGMGESGTITGGGPVVMIRRGPPPAISSISPTTGTAGTTVAEFTLNGSNLSPTSTLSFSGYGISVDSYSTRTANQIVARISIAASAASGMRNVIVTNPDGQSAILFSAFTVVVPCVAPSISVQPKGTTIDPGGTAVVQVTAAGTQPLRYQWYEGAQGNTTKPVGTNSAQFSSPSLSGATSYWVRVSNACGQVDSQAALIVIRDFPSASGRNWISRGPEGGVIGALAINPQNPSRLYAGSYGGGVFRSDTGGSSWKSVNTGLTNLNVKALVIDPQSPATIYAGTSGGGVFKSSNGGDTWSAVNNQLTDSYVLALAISPQSPATLYAGTASGGIFRSSNGGANWSVVNTGLTDRYIQTLAVDPRNATRVYAGTQTGGIFRSTNSGSSWSAVNTGLLDKNVFALAVDPQSSMTIYAGTLSGGVFRSTNGGDSWTAANTGLQFQNVYALAIDPQNPATVYTGTFLGGVYRSSNGGATWSAINTGLTHTYVDSLAVDPRNPRTVYAGTDGTGVYKSSDAGTTWSAANSGLNMAAVFALAVDPLDPATLYAGTFGGGVFKSSNGGASWSKASAGLTYPWVVTLAIDPRNPATIYAGTNYSGVFKSTDGGASWSNASTGLPNGYVRTLLVDPLSPATIYAGTSGDGVFKSLNGGGTWSAVNAGLTNTKVGALAIEPQNPAIVYVGTSGGGVFKSSNGGGSWSSASAGLANMDVMALAVDPQNPATLYAGTNGGAHKSSNGGASWSVASTGMTKVQIPALAVDSQNPATVYAGTLGGGVFKSSDRGASWSAVSTGFTDALVWALALDPQYPARVYTGTYGRGVSVSSPLAKVRLAVSAGGAISASTIGPAEPLVPGYAIGTAQSGSVPYGTAVLSYAQDGVVVSEVGVPASPPTLGARIFVDSRINVSAGTGKGTISVVTGFAAVNPNTATATLSLRLRDSEGRSLTQGNIRLAKGEHIAKFLDQLAPDFVLPAGFASFGLGSLEIISDLPVSVLALRLTTNQRGGLLLTSTPIADLSKPASSGTLAFPQIADGGGYQTTLILMNTSASLQTGVVRLYGNSGLALNVRMTNVSAANSVYQYSIPAGGFLRLVTDASPSSVNVGWAQLTPDAGTTAPVSAALFGLAQGGVLVTETGVPAVTATTRARIYVDKSSGHDTGLAVANPGSSNIRITATAYQPDGVTRAGTGAGTIDLVPSGHDARFAGQLIAGLPDGFTGVLDLTSAAPFAALTLRSLINGRGDFLITTFPIADANQAPPSPLIFPQIVDGGGYRTQIILLDTSGKTLAATVNYYGNDGSPVVVGRVFD